MYDHDQSTSPDVFDMSGSAGLYYLTWPNLHIKAEVARFEEKHSELKAEVSFSSQRPNASGHVLRRRVNLTSPSAAYIKDLREEDDSINWKRIVEQLAVAGTDEYRRGMPAIELLGQIKAEPEGRWLIKPLVQVGHPTLLYGEGSSGKSWIGQYLSVLVQEGLSASGLEVEQAKVLYLDWETDVQEIGSRIAMIRSGLGLPAQYESGVVYKYMTQGLEADIAVVRNLVQEKGIHFVVLDSLGSACMGEPESAEVVLKMFGALRSLGVTSLCIDHTNKNDVLFGSVYKRNSSRQVFHAKKSQREQDQEFEFAIVHEKANNSRLVAPLGWVLQFDNDEGTATFTRQDVKESRLEGVLKLKDRIRNFLMTSKSPQSVSTIAQELQTSDGSISKELSMNKDMFMRVAKGMYENVLNEDEAKAKDSIDIPPPGATEWEA